MLLSKLDCLSLESLILIDFQTRKVAENIKQIGSLLAKHIAPVIRSLTQGHAQRGNCLPALWYCSNRL